MSDPALARDGSPVGLYAALPSFGEAELVHSSIPPGARILELGSGAGRMTRRLVELGHPVTAVDESEEMLAHVRNAQTVHSRIEELHLGRRFPVVLLASRVINQPTAAVRAAILAACARHLSPDGQLLIETYPPGWHPLPGQTSVRGELRVTLSEAIWRDGVMTGVVDYEMGEGHWSHGPFQARPLAEEELRGELRDVGLRFESWLDDAHTWLSARPAVVAQ